MYREAHSLHSAENGRSLEFLLGTISTKEALSHRETAKSSQSNRWKGVFLAPDTPIAESCKGG